MRHAIGRALIAVAVAAALLEVVIKGQIRRVQLASGKPAIQPFVVTAEDCRRFLEPANLPGLLTPEIFGVLQASPVTGFVSSLARR